MKKSGILVSLVVLSLGLAGCAANDNAGGNNNNDGQQVQNNQDRPRMLNVDQDNQSLRIAERAEQQVEKMPAVEDAHVIIYNNEAYVALSLNNINDAEGNRTNNGNNGEADRNGNVNNTVENNGNARVNEALDGNGRTFMENGSVNPERNNNRDDGIIEGEGDARSGNNENTGLGNRNNNAVGSDNDADNAPIINEYREVSTAFEQKVADQVRQADKKIHKVYVSVNADFYNRMGTFADEIRTDRNRDGLLADFNNTVNDFFDWNND